MAAYMIFVEGMEMSSRTADITESLGIGEIELGESHLTWLQTADGPTGKPGLLGFWMDPENAGLRGYEPDNQKWVTSPDGTFWIGAINDRPLGPGDVERIKTHDGSLSVTLEDGNDWEIPIARCLPHRWGQNGVGIPLRIPTEKYRVFCQQADGIFQQLAGYSGSEDLEVSGPWSYVCDALSLNYRLSPAIISALGLVGDESGGAIIRATIEWEKITKDALQKKTESQSTANAI
jgi:hypothetical protein